MASSGSASKFAHPQFVDGSRRATVFPWDNSSLLFKSEVATAQTLPK